MRPVTVAVNPLNVTGTYAESLADVSLYRHLYVKEPPPVLVDAVRVTVTFPLTYRGVTVRPGEEGVPRGVALLL